MAGINVLLAYTYIWFICYYRQCMNQLLIPGQCDCHTGYTQVSSTSICDAHQCGGFACYNGGTCVAGACVCAVGFLGSECTTGKCIQLKPLGIWQMKHE